MAIFNFTQDTSYKERPFAGVEDWQGQDYAGIPTATNRAQRKDYYIRLSWSQLEGANQGNYTFSKLDTEFRKAMDRRQRISFGIMTVCPGGCDSFNGPVSYDGASSIYPQYLHNLMQSESVKDWRLNGTWVPNWNSNHYLGRMEALLLAMANYIATTTYRPAWSATPIRYADVLNYVDIRHMGSWGEWHHANIVDPVSNYPSGMRPTVATYKRIIDAHVAAFQDYPLVMLMATLDAMWFNNTQTPNEVTWYALTKSNNWGPIGIRRDQWGSAAWSSADNYVHHYMENNNRSFGTSGPFKNTIMERWKTSPILGEPEGGFSDIPNIVAEARLYHAVSIGNGNFATPAGDARMRELANVAGYKLRVTSVNVTNTANQLVIAAGWVNDGITPTYENWDVVYELKNGSTVVWSGKSSFKPKRFLPTTTPLTVSDTFAVNIPAGTYSLSFSVKDPTGYREAMPLFMTGGTANVFSLGSVTIGGGQTNQPPVVNAGIDRTVIQPVSNVTISGTASDDGTIASTVWTRVAGSGTIVSPNQLITDISGLALGVNTFRLTVTDTQGLSSFDEMSVTVQAATNTPPVVNAGSDQSITLPTNSVILSGTATDAQGPVTAVVWTRISGSGTILAPNSLTTTVSNLSEGTSVFRLVGTDSGGLQAADNVTVIVNPAPARTIRSITQTILYTDGTTQTQTIS